MLEFINFSRTVFYPALCKIVVLCCAVVVAGCAVKQPGGYAEHDPWEGYNRGVFAMNETVDTVVLRPVATVYRTLVPDPVRQATRNFFSNLDDVMASFNNLLQGKIVSAGSDVLRLLVNTTFGVAGIFDVAGKLGLPKHEEDFGQTLATWGVGPGPYFVLPLLGSSTLRDFSGEIVNRIINPISHLDKNNARRVLYAMDAVQRREHFIDQEQIARKWTPDFYAAIRRYYLSRRDSLISDGMVEIDYDDEELE